MPRGRCCWPPATARPTRLRPTGTERGDGDAAYELSTTTPEPTGDIDSFTWSLYAEPFSLAYPYAFDYPPNQSSSNVCESLLRWNADLSISPALAAAVDNPDPDDLGLHDPRRRHLP